MEDESGQEFFWGFTIVIIRVPEIFSDSVKPLSDFGYQYCLSKTGSPWEEAYEVVDCSGGSISAPVSYTFEIGGSVWKLEVMPQNGWVEKSYLYSIFGGGLLIVLLLTGLTAALLILDENRQELRKLALTDALTGIYNRHGFDKHVTVYMKKYPEKHCVGVQFDIDDFKLINDIYGHASGDKALQILAESMRKFFPDHAVLGRNGGDEFCIFLPDCTCKEAEEKLAILHQNIEETNQSIEDGKKKNWYSLQNKSVSLFMKVRNAHLTFRLDMQNIRFMQNRSCN